MILDCFLGKPEVRRGGLGNRAQRPNGQSSEVLGGIRRTPRNLTSNTPITVRSTRRPGVIGKKSSVRNATTSFIGNWTSHGQLRNRTHYVQKRSSPESFRRCKKTPRVYTRRREGWPTSVPTTYRLSRRDSSRPTYPQKLSDGQ